MIDYKGISLAKIVKNKIVNFDNYTKGELWYNIVIDTGLDLEVFTFPVPISEAGDGVFLVEDKATIFMRYIRKHLELIEKGRQDAEDNTQGLFIQV